jgi:hypothetical protein
VGTFLLALALLLPGTARAVSITVSGPEQVIFQRSTMACESADYADAPMRAFRDSLGRVQIVMSHIVHRRMIGPDFDNLTHPCDVMTYSAHNADPAASNDNLWITGIYTQNGRDVFALAHNEYHGQWHQPGPCPSNDFQSCHWNTVMLITSANNGDTYNNGPPNPVVASMPIPYLPDGGRYGFFGTSNIVTKDGYFYTMLLTTPGMGLQRNGVCVARTRDIADPGSWRAWDGASFSARFVNPYRESVEPLKSHVCEPVSNSNILEMNRSLTWNTVLNKWVLTGTSGKFDPSQSRTVWGFYYSVSDDLIHWSSRQLLMETETFQTYQCGDPDPLHYPSLIDPDSPDRNFSTADGTAQLYFTRIHMNAMCQLNPDRDLVRVPIQISP